jgi:hypothetical protein
VERAREFVHHGILRLTVFDSRFYVFVGRVDEFVQGGGIGFRAGLQLYVSHEFAFALKQVGRVGQGRALIEPDVYV